MRRSVPESRCFVFAAQVLVVPVVVALEQRPGVVDLAGAAGLALCRFQSSECQ